MLNQNELLLIKNYLSGTTEYGFDELHNEENFIIWIDWHDEDVSIVKYCENILQTGHLSARILTDYTELEISYKGDTHIVTFDENSAYRDETLQPLAEILSPDYQLRFCLESDGSDTLAFLLISNQEMKALENEFGTEHVAEYFIKITPDLVMFG